MAKFLTLLQYRPCSPTSPKVPVRLCVVAGAPSGGGGEGGGGGGGKEWDVQQLGYTIAYTPRQKCRGQKFDGDEIGICNEFVTGPLKVHTRECTVPPN